MKNINFCKQIALTFTLVLIFTGSAMAESYKKPEFIRSFAACIYPYFAAGFKTSLSGEAKDRALSKFSRNILDQGVDLDMPLNKSTLDYLCSQYADTEVPDSMSRHKFKAALQRIGIGSIASAFESAH